MQMFGYIIFISQIKQLLSQKKNTISAETLKWSPDRAELLLLLMSRTDLKQR